MKKLTLLSTLIIFSLHALAQKWEKTQPDILYATDKNGGAVNVKVGIGTNNPSQKLEVINGSIKMTDGNQGSGKLFTSDANGVGSWQAPIWIIDGNIIVNNYDTRDMQVFGTFLPLGFPNIAGNGTSLDIVGDKTNINQARINFDPANGVLNFYAGTPVGNPPAFVIDNGNVTVNGTLNAQTFLQNGNPIQSSQWTTNPDGSISFNGRVFVKRLDASEGISIGNFKFSNGGGITPAPIDSIVSPKPIAISADKSIQLRADTVMLGNGSGRVGITPSPIAGNVRLDVTGDIQASGCVTASCLNVSGQTQFDSVQVNNKIKVGTNSLIIESLTTQTGPTNNIYTDNTGNTDLLIQSIFGNNNHTFINARNFGRVGIGLQTVPQGKLDVFLPSPSAFSLASGLEDSRAIILNSIGRGIAIGGDVNNGMIQGIDNNLGTQSLHLQPIGGSVLIGTFNSLPVYTPSSQIGLEVKGSVSIYDGNNSNPSNNGDFSLFFGREQNTLLAPATDFGEWGIQYWSAVDNGTGRGGLNFWKPFGSDIGYGNNGFGNGLLFLGDDGRIGINTYNPQSRLEIIGSGVSNITSSLHVLNSNSSSLLFVQDDGKIGIGNTNPGCNVDIVSPAGFNGICVNTNQAIGYGFNVRSTLDNILTKGFSVFNPTLNPNADQFVVYGDGRTIIGADNINSTQVTPQNHPDYLLAVFGKIVGTKLVSTNVSFWADDEFKKESSFNDLEKEKQFTKENSHLIDVPSEKDVLANGIEMGDMFSMQLRKIEQLYKYSFLFNTEIKQLKSENEKLKDEINELKQRVQAIEKK